jgi:hypothetical protein
MIQTIQISVYHGNSQVFSLGIDHHQNQMGTGYELALSLRPMRLYVKSFSRHPLISTDWNWITGEWHNHRHGRP